MRGTKKNLYGRGCSFLLLMLLSCLFALAFSSCLEAAVDAGIDAQGLVRFSIVYSQAKAISSMGLVSSPATRPRLPSDRAVLESDLLGISGAKVTKWNILTDNDTSLRIEAGIELGDLEGFATLLSRWGMASSYVKNAGENILSVRLVPGKLYPNDEMKKIAEALYANYRCQITMQFPSPPECEGLTDIRVSGNTMLLDKRSLDLAESESAIKLVISWR
jgi:hypothetical protein